MQIFAIILKTHQKKHLKVMFNRKLFYGTEKNVRFPTLEKKCLTGRDYCAQWYQPDQPDCIAY